SEGLPLTEAVEEVSAYAQVFAAGANCFKLAWTVDVVKNLRASKLPIVVYPNSGAEYDPSVKKWVYPPEAADF
ncbi:homocysteine S-methyltransferase family protein, partial [Escherichia coli]